VCSIETSTTPLSIHLRQRVSTSACGIARSASFPAILRVDRAVPLIADQCPGPLGFQLTKLFESRSARRDFRIFLARGAPTSATRFRHAGVSASMAIWSSVSLSSSASEYGILRSLLGSSQDGSVLFDASSSMSCPVPLPQSNVACWRRSVLLSNSLTDWHWFCSSFRSCCQRSVGVI
jgi:hypothetical protein